MTADQFRDVLDEFGLTQQSCARFLEVDDRTVRRWATGDQAVPKSICLLFEMMRHFHLTVDAVERIGMAY